MSKNELVSTKSGSNLEVLGMEISSLTEAMQVAELFAKSDLVPKDYKGRAGNIVVAWQKGYEVGLMPQQSLETIAVINGRASIWGDGLIALIKNSPKEEWTKEYIKGEGDKAIAYCETKRKGQANVVKASFSVAQAKTAGLWGNNTWKKYPMRMLQMRARGFCFRDAYPDVLNGLQLAEEQLDAENSNRVENIDEIEKAVKSFGLNLSKNEGIAIVEGNTFEHSKALKELGFSIEDKKWVIYYDDDTIDVEISESTTPKDKEESVSPAVKLFKILKEKDMQNEEIQEFISDFLGLSRENTKELQELIDNEENLKSQLEDFWQVKAGQVSEETVTEDDVDKLF